MNQRKTNCNLNYLLLQYTTKEDLLPHLLECDIIVYDITGSPDQVDEATWAVSGEFNMQNAINFLSDFYMFGEN